MVCASVVSGSFMKNDSEICPWWWLYQSVPFPCWVRFPEWIHFLHACHCRKTVSVSCKHSHHHIKGYWDQVYPFPASLPVPGLPCCIPRAFYSYIFRSRARKEVPQGICESVCESPFYFFIHVLYIVQLGCLFSLNYKHSLYCEYSLLDAEPQAISLHW